MCPEAPNPGPGGERVSEPGPPESEVEVIRVRTGTDAGVHG